MSMLLDEYISDTARRSREKRARDAAARTVGGVACYTIPITGPMLKWFISHGHLSQQDAEDTTPGARNKVSRAITKYFERKLLGEA
jgi:hypothetical protein